MSLANGGACVRISVATLDGRRREMGIGTDHPAALVAETLHTTTEALYRLSLFSDHGARLIVEFNGEKMGATCGRFPIRGIVLLIFQSGESRRVEVLSLIHI